VQTFLRGIHVVDYTEAALKDVAGYVVTLAKAENLPAHGEAVRRRFGGPERSDWGMKFGGPERSDSGMKFGGPERSDAGMRPEK
jgi:hypothetical protein